MVANTPINGLRLAELTDSANLQTAFSNIGTDLDSRLFPRFADTSARDAAITSPVAGMVCYVASFNLPMMYYGSFWGFLHGAPVAVIYKNTAQSIAHDTLTAIQFDAEEFDLLGGHSTVTNNTRYTPPVQGRYQFHGGCSFAINATGFRAAGFRKNGSALQIGPQTVLAAYAGAERTAVFSSSYVVLNGTTDYVELVVKQGSGGSLNTDTTDASAYPAMQITYMGPV